MLDESGTVYVTGQAASGFPVTAGAYDSTVGGTFDGHATKLSADGSALLFDELLHRVDGFWGQIDLHISTSSKTFVHIDNGAFLVPVVPWAVPVSKWVKTKAFQAIWGGP